jgi:hypothetical protein
MPLGQVIGFVTPTVDPLTVPSVVVMVISIAMMEGYLVIDWRAFAVTVPVEVWVSEQWLLAHWAAPVLENFANDFAKLPQLLTRRAPHPHYRCSGQKPELFGRRVHCESP